MPSKPDTETKSVTLMSSTYGWGIAAVGGLVAQVPDNWIASAGAITAIGGLLGGFYTAVQNGLQKYWDYRLALARIEGQDAKLATLQVELDRAHARIAQFESQTTAVAAKVDANAQAMTALAPVTRELAKQGGLAVTIPDPAEVAK